MTGTGEKVLRWQQMPKDKYLVSDSEEPERGIATVTELEFETMRALEKAWGYKVDEVDFALLRAQESDR